MFDWFACLPFCPLGMVHHTRFHLRKWTHHDRAWSSHANLLHIYCHLSNRRYLFHDEAHWASNRHICFLIAYYHYLNLTICVFRNRSRSCLSSYQSIFHLLRASAWHHDRYAYCSPSFLHRSCHLHMSSCLSPISYRVPTGPGKWNHFDSSVHRSRDAFRWASLHHTQRPPACLNTCLSRDGGRLVHLPCRCYHLSMYSYLYQWSRSLWNHPCRLYHQSIWMCLCRLEDPFSILLCIHVHLWISKCLVHDTHGKSVKEFVWFILVLMTLTWPFFS